MSERRYTAEEVSEIIRAAAAELRRIANSEKDKELGMRLLSTARKYEQAADMFKTWAWIYKDFFLEKEDRASRPSAVR